MLYSDDEEKAFEDSRAVILTSSRAVRGDLARRSQAIRLNPIAEHTRWTESELMDEFEKVQPLVFCAHILEGLRRHDGVKLERLPSMAFFCKRTVPFESTYWPTGAFTVAYKDAQAPAV